MKVFLFIAAFALASCVDKGQEKTGVIFNVPKYLNSLDIDSVIADIGNPVQVSNERNIYIFKKDNYRMRVWISKNKIDTSVIFPIEIWRGNPNDIINDDDFKMLNEASNIDSLDKMWSVQQKYDINGGHLSEIGIRKNDANGKQ